MRTVAYVHMSELETDRVHKLLVQHLGEWPNARRKRSKMVVGERFVHLLSTSIPAAAAPNCRFFRCEKRRMAA